MGDQFRDLLVDLSRKLEGIDRLTGDVLAREKQLERDFRRQEIELAKIQQDLKWTGEDRRKVDGRLQTGDHTFLKLQSEIANAQQVANAAHSMAKTAIAAAEASRDANADKPTGIRKKIKKHIVEALVPMAIGAVWWALYHFLLIGPEIAKFMKAIKEGGHP